MSLPFYYYLIHLAPSTSTATILYSVSLELNLIRTVFVLD